MIDEDIIAQLGYTRLDQFIGDPEDITEKSYPDLIQLRKLYFNNILEELKIGKYRELFKWIDNTYTSLVYSLVPRTTNFMGINFIYESHILERNKLKYLHDEIYLKSLPRNADRGNIFLSQFVCKVKKG